ncbi:hypothetical protein MNBD_ALPHA11-1742, partial [hydrothermal vent metagenome]
MSILPVWSDKFISIYLQVQVRFFPLVFLSVLVGETGLGSKIAGK